MLIKKIIKINNGYHVSTKVKALWSSSLFLKKKYFKTCKGLSSKSKLLGSDKRKNKFNCYIKKTSLFFFKKISFVFFFFNLNFFNKFITKYKSILGVYFFNLNLDLRIFELFLPYLKLNFYLKTYISTINQKVKPLFGLSENKKISKISSYPYNFCTIANSVGTFGIFLRFSKKLGLLLIKQPSGIRKVIDRLSLCLVFYKNSALIRINKLNNKAGFFFKKKRLTSARGIAKNPVDHPHGGRNKAIKIKKSPWGLTNNSY